MLIAFNADSNAEFCFETSVGYMLYFLAYKMLRATVILFFSNFFQSSFSQRNFIPFQLYFFIKGLIFVNFCFLLIFGALCLFFHDLTQLLQPIEIIYYLVPWYEVK